MNKSIYSDDHKELVERLKEARLNAGLDQQKAAELLGRSQSFLSKIESGQRRVDLVQLREFARIYKKPLEFFIK